MGNNIFNWLIFLITIIIFKYSATQIPYDTTHLINNPAIKLYTSDVTKSLFRNNLHPKNNEKSFKIHNDFESDKHLLKDDEYINSDDINVIKNENFDDTKSLSESDLKEPYDLNDLNSKPYMIGYKGEDNVDDLVKYLRTNWELPTNYLQSRGYADVLENNDDNDFEIKSESANNENDEDLLEDNDFKIRKRRKSFSNKEQEHLNDKNNGSNTIQNESNQENTEPSKLVENSIESDEEYDNEDTDETTIAPKITTIAPNTSTEIGFFQKLKTKISNIFYSNKNDSISSLSDTNPNQDEFDSFEDPNLIPFENENSVYQMNEEKEHDDDYKEGKEEDQTEQKSPLNLKYNDNDNNNYNKRNSNDNWLKYENSNYFQNNYNNDFLDSSLSTSELSSQVSALKKDKHVNTASGNRVVTTTPNYNELFVNLTKPEIGFVKNLIKCFRENKKKYSINFLKKGKNTTKSSSSLKINNMKKIPTKNITTKGPCNAANLAKKISSTPSTPSTPSTVSTSTTNHDYVYNWITNTPITPLTPYKQTDELKIDFNVKGITNDSTLNTKDRCITNNCYHHNLKKFKSNNIDNLIKIKNHKYYENNLLSPVGYIKNRFLINKRSPILSLFQSSSLSSSTLASSSSSTLTSTSSFASSSLPTNDDAVQVYLDICDENKETDDNKLETSTKPTIISTKKTKILQNNKNTGKSSKNSNNKRKKLKPSKKYYSIKIEINKIPNNSSDDNTINDINSKQISNLLLKEFNNWLKNLCTSYVLNTKEKLYNPYKCDNDESKMNTNTLNLNSNQINDNEENNFNISELLNDEEISKLKSTNLQFGTDIGPLDLEKINAKNNILGTVPDCKFQNLLKFLAHLHHSVESVGKYGWKKCLDKLKRNLNIPININKRKNLNDMNHNCNSVKLNEISFDFELNPLRKYKSSKTSSTYADNHLQRIATNFDIKDIISNSRFEQPQQQEQQEEQNNQVWQSATSRFLRDVDNSYSALNLPLEAPYTENFVDSYVDNDKELKLNVTNDNSTKNPIKRNVIKNFNENQNGNEIDKILSDLSSSSSELKSGSDNYKDLSNSDEPNLINDYNDDLMVKNNDYYSNIDNDYDEEYDYDYMNDPIERTTEKEKKTNHNIFNNENNRNRNAINGYDNDGNIVDEHEFVSKIRKKKKKNRKYKKNDNSNLNNSSELLSTSTLRSTSTSTSTSTLPSPLSSTSNSALNEEENDMMNRFFYIQSLNDELKPANKSINIRNHDNDNSNMTNSNNTTMNTTDFNNKNDFNAFSELNDIKYRLNSEQEEAIKKFIEDLDSPPKVFTFDVDKYIKPQRNVYDNNNNNYNQQVEVTSPKQFYEFPQMLLINENEKEKISSHETFPTSIYDENSLSNNNDNENFILSSLSTENDNEKYENVKNINNFRNNRIYNKNVRRHSLNKIPSKYHDKRKRDLPTKYRNMKNIDNFHNNRNYNKNSVRHNSNKKPSEYYGKENHDLFKKYKNSKNINNIHNNGNYNKNSVRRNPNRIPLKHHNKENHNSLTKYRNVKNINNSHDNTNYNKKFFLHNLNKVPSKYHDTGKRDLLRQYIKGRSAYLKDHNLVSNYISSPMETEIKDEEPSYLHKTQNSFYQNKVDEIINSLYSPIDTTQYENNNQNILTKLNNDALKMKNDDFIDKYYLLNDGKAEINFPDSKNLIQSTKTKYNPVNMNIDLELDKKFRELQNFNHNSFNDIDNNNNNDISNNNGNNNNRKNRHNNNNEFDDEEDTFDAHIKRRPLMKKFHH